MITYEALGAALKRTGIPFAEGGWEQGKTLPGAYGVYAPDDRTDLIADGHHAEKLVEGTVDLFSRDRGDRQAAVIEALLEETGVGWQINLPGHYEADTGLTHWEWVFRCLP